MTALAITYAVLCIIYVLLYAYYTIDSFMALYKLPFQQHRLENMFMRYKVRQLT